VPTLEERVAYLEGKVEELSNGYGQLPADIAALRQTVGALDHRLSARIDALDQKVDRFREELSGRIDALDHRLSARIDALDQKFSRWFAWLTGILVTALLAQLGLLGAALFRR
jgi:outer membrane murein-binding lipoprotein Lpp